MRYIPIIGLYWFFKKLKNYDDYDEHAFALMAIGQAAYHTFFITLIFLMVYGR